LPSVTLLLFTGPPSLLFQLPSYCLIVVLHFCLPFVYIYIIYLYTYIIEGRKRILIKKEDPNPHDPYKDDEKEIPSLDMRKILLGVAAITLFFERAGII
jgi:hypothetical protein